MGLWARLFGKRQTAPMTASSPVMVQQEDYATPLPPGTGWRLSHRVSEDDMYVLFGADRIEMWRYGWDRPSIVNPRALSNTPVVGDVWWRPVP